jgi:hypothetical protein
VRGAEEVFAELFNNSMGESIAWAKIAEHFPRASEVIRSLIEALP